MNKTLKWEIAESAVFFRNELGYSSDVPIQLEALLLKKNVITVFKPLSENFSGMAIRTSDDIRFLLVNRNHTTGRQNFTIGHELYHLFIQRDFVSQQCVTGNFDRQNDPEEKKADYFSACLLLPESGVRQLIPKEERARINKISDATVIKIQQYFQVSVNAVLFRLVEFGFLDSSCFERFRNEKKALARKLGYDIGLFEPGKADRFIGNYGIIANDLFERRKISESYYIELLNAMNIDPFAIGHE